MTCTEEHESSRDGRPFIDPNELSIHKLYRERIVQEDGLINHRMMWMVLSQAFLLAMWGVLLQRAIELHSSSLKLVAIVVAIIGILFAVGSLFSIKAAQDEIANLRANYLVMFPAKTDLNTPPAISNRSVWQWLIDLADTLSKYLSGSSDLFEHPPQHVPTIKGKLCKDPLPGLTGSRNFHRLGHLVPRYMPAMIVLLWIILSFLVVATPVGAPALAAAPQQLRTPGQPSQ